MNEINDGIMESTAAETAESADYRVAEELFEAGWEEDAAPGDLTEADDHSAEEDTEDGAEEREPEGEKTETTAEAPKEEAPAQKEAQKLFRIKHMDDGVKEYTEAEVTMLAQKGLDYDRIREKYDESKPVMEFIRRHAKEANMTPQEFVEALRKNELVNSGMSEAEAQRSIELEKREADVAAKEAAETERQTAEQNKASEEAATKERIKRESEEFRQNYPDVKAEDIPEAVWADVSRGATLLTAYMKHENAQLRTQLAAKTQNAKNAGRGTGSQQTAGSGNDHDPFDDGWDD